MGEVYRAEDTKLGREVAIKVLPEAFTSDPERFARFEREAHVLASLNHPNIGAIHDLAEDQGTHFLVLELAEGEDLAARLSRGPIPIEDALPLALQIAESRASVGIPRPDALLSSVSPVLGQLLASRRVRVMADAIVILEGGVAGRAAVNDLRAQHLKT